MRLRPLPQAILLLALLALWLVAVSRPTGRDDGRSPAADQYIQEVAK